MLIGTSNPTPPSFINSSKYEVKNKLTTKFSSEWIQAISQITEVNIKSTRSTMV